jgi:2-polyprenyl-3-methyl-5-hydroxy-6-metoxy-1,4-benzoquinol methylase
MNDVYEHVTDPIAVLTQLRGKLNPGGRIFIDTPCSFWMYYVFRPFLPRLQEKFLRGTVDEDHQQIWSKQSFVLAAKKAGFSVIKMRRLSEHTQSASFYMNNMGVRNPLARMAGHVFVFLAPYIAKNKIMAVLR